MLDRLTLERLAVFALGASPSICFSNRIRQYNILDFKRPYGEACRQSRGSMPSASGPLMCRSISLKGNKMRNGLKALLAALAVTTALGTAAHAADLPARLAPPAPLVAAVPVFTWTGFYIGVNAGYGWNTNNDDVVINGTTYEADDEGGFVGGGQVGYNYQIGSFVVGLETDIQYADIGGDNDFGGILDDDDSESWFGTVRARAGYAFDRALIYATGGLAYGEVSNGFSSSDDVSVGWTIGAGVEYAFTNNLTAKVEGLYVNLEQDDDDLPVVAGQDETEFGVIRAGLNYKFSSY
jgi:outer membrane immunogenic protein